MENVFISEANDIILSILLAYLYHTLRCKKVETRYQIVKEFGMLTRRRCYC